MAKKSNKKSAATLTPIQCAAMKIAAAKINKDVTWRDALAVGDMQAVDVCVRIRGNIKVAEDRPGKAGTAKVAPQVDIVLALMLDKLGESGRKALDAVVDDWAAKRVMPESSESAAEQVEASLASMTQTVDTASAGAKGSVSGMLSVETATPAVLGKSTSRKVTV
jgi:hypothetical protein